MSRMVPRPPLPALLSRVLIALAWEYQQAGGEQVRLPSLPLWSNLLRCAGEEGIALRDLPRLARLSKRATGALVDGAERRWGLVAVEAAAAPRAARILRLTEQGRRAREAGQSMLAQVEERWRTRFGADRLDPLRSSLEALVRQLALELPHYPMGYGMADHSMTGGRHVPEKPGPPRIPAHGQDWSPVLREGGDPLTGLPLSALLSQAVVAFAIDYEREACEAMATAANLLRVIGDEGLLLRELPPGASGVGWGDLRPGRHGKLVVELDPVNPRTKRVRLTPEARRTRDAYGPLVAEIECRWQGQYGEEVLRTLRAALEPVVSELGSGLAHFPTVVWIGGVFAEGSRPTHQSVGSS